jgi:CTP:molybdopterin cytidylyltransferase MocA
LRSAAVIPSGVLVLTLDRPRLLPATLAALGAAHREHPDALVEPACGGRRGHPPLLPWRLAVAALDAPESTTLRDLLRAARATGDAAALRVDVPDGAVHENVDTPADLV